MAQIPIPPADASWRANVGRRPGSPRPRRRAAGQAGRSFLHHPGEARVGQMAPRIGHGRHVMDDVAERGRLDEQNLGHDRRSELDGCRRLIYAAPCFVTRGSSKDGVAVAGPTRSLSFGANLKFRACGQEIPDAKERTQLPSLSPAAPAISAATWSTRCATPASGSSCSTICPPASNGRSDDGDLLSAPCFDTNEEGVERTRRSRGGPSRLDQQATRHRSAMLGDTAVMSASTPDWRTRGLSPK
jgi:hypothetical protein